MSGGGAIWTLTPSVVNVPNLAGDNFSVSRFAASAGGSDISLFKSRGATVGTNVVVQANDTLGSISFFGADGATNIRAARIRAIVDGTPGTNDMPGALMFDTTPDGSTTNTNRAKLDKDGNWTMLGAVSVPDEAYGASWDGSTNVPTKNAVYDKIQTLGSSDAASYRSLLDCTGSHTAARAAGTYWMPQGQPLGITGVGTLYAPNIIYFDPADYPAAGALTAKLRLRIGFYTNDVAPGGNYTFGLYPVTRPAVSGAAGLAIYTMGTVVASSTALATTPVADSLLNFVSIDFAMPVAGHYVIGMVSSAAVAASAHIHISAILQMRYS